MWTADGWTDYELLDCTSGRRLERWGEYILSRPDPQVIWQSKRADRRWESPDAVYTRSSTGGGSWSVNTLPERFELSYDGLRFYAGLMNFKHTGVFPEQASNWQFIEKQVKRRNAPKVLNLFGYTGLATLFAARAGAQVTHVDAAKGMVRWARGNAAVSGLDDAPVRWIVDDCKVFVEREIRRGNRYDAIIMDPPSFGRGPTGELWKLEDDLYPFLLLAERVLSDTPLFVLISSYTTGLSPSVLTYMLGTVFAARRGGNAVSGELGLTTVSSGLVLPCGAAGRWTIGD